MLRVWNRVFKIDKSRRTRNMFEYDYKIFKKNWYNDMKQCFNILGKMSIFEKKTSCNIKELQIYDRIWKEKWKKNLPNKSKLRTYISFKEQYCTEIVLNCVFMEREDLR